MSTVTRHQYTFSITGQDEIDFQTARSKFKVIDIVRLGIKEALRNLPKPTKMMIQKARNTKPAEKGNK